MKNYQRQIVKILSEIAQENGYSFYPFCDDFCIEISNAKAVTRIFGYQFDNPTSASTIATDKCACFELLKKHGIPAIPHFLILPPEKAKYVESPKTIADYIEKYPTMVVKPCKGTSGDHVLKISSLLEYATAEEEILPFSRDIALSPYFEIGQEFRCVVLNGKIQLIYEKIRGEDWKHNLAKGATVQIVDTNKCEDLANLAVRTACTIGLEFCAVDIAVVKGENMVLEVNSGVMFERFSKFSNDNYQIAKNIYEKGVKYFLGELL